MQHASRPTDWAPPDRSGWRARCRPAPRRRSRRARAACAAAQAAPPASPAGSIAAMSAPVALTRSTSTSSPKRSRSTLLSPRCCRRRAARAWDRGRAAAWCRCAARRSRSMPALAPCVDDGLGVALDPAAFHGASQHRAVGVSRRRSGATTSRCLRGRSVSSASLPSVTTGSGAGAVAAAGGGAAGGRRVVAAGDRRRVRARSSAGAAARARRGGATRRGATSCAAAAWPVPPAAALPAARRQGRPRPPSSPARVMAGALDALRPARTRACVVPGHSCADGRRARVRRGRSPLRSCRLRRPPRRPRAAPPPSPSRSARRSPCSRCAPPAPARHGFVGTFVAGRSLRRRASAKTVGFRARLRHRVRRDVSWWGCSPASRAFARHRGRRAGGGAGAAARRLRRASACGGKRSVSSQSSSRSRPRSLAASGPSRRCVFEVVVFLERCGATGLALLGKRARRLRRYAPVRRDRS